MKISERDTTTIDNKMMTENIIKSMIASFRIENINITEKTVREIYEKVKKRLKK